MTNLPNRDDREAKIYYCGPRAVENLLLLKKWFRWLSPQRAPQAKAQLPCLRAALVGVVVAAEISIIKIGLVYVIMIVITSWRHHTHQPVSFSSLLSSWNNSAVFKRLL